MINLQKSVISPTADNDGFLSQQEIQQSTESKVFEGLQQYKEVPKTISLGQVDVGGKPVNLTMELFTLGNPQHPKMYFLEADGKPNIGYYSIEGGREILGGGGTGAVYDRGDIDINGNDIYMRDGNKRWLKYNVKKMRDDKIGFILQERMIYNPLRSVPRTVGKNNDMSLVEYTNPPERGNIHPEKFQPTKGKLLIIHNRGSHKEDKIVEFPHTEGVTLDESTARLYDSYELFINDTESKTHKYEINVGEPKLREMPIRD